MSWCVNNRLCRVSIALAVLGLVGWFPLKTYLVGKYSADFFVVGYSLMLQRLGLEEGPDESARKQSAAAVVPAVEAATGPSGHSPFHDIGDTLGDLGRFNSMQIMHGVAVFDANSDGRPDFFVPHSGRPVEKLTDKRGVLLEDPMPAKPCTLFLNQGNDARGDPIFRTIQEIAAGGNREHLQAELLIENKYRPRASLTDDMYAPGRIATGVVAADFNADGRPDLYVSNSHYGFFTQTEKYALRVYPTQGNIGRNDKQAVERVLVRADPFLGTDMSDGAANMVSYGSEPEPEGRNSLFINMGDADGDGIPEWKDATDEAGVGGKWASTGVTVSDFDRDGDLDIYVSNFLDPDFWGFGAKFFAGARNQLYVNQLAESGKFVFLERARELKVAGLHDEEGLADGIWNALEGRHMVTSLDSLGGRQVGEKADHTWTSLFSDFNRDGWPDLIVANDLSNRLRVYENNKGKEFRYLKQFDDYAWDGCWMGAASADFDGDLDEEIMVGGCGTQAMTVRSAAIFVEDGKEANIWALFNQNYLRGKSTMHHVLLSFDRAEGLRDIGGAVKINHSPLIPPDIVNARNRLRGHDQFFREKRFETSLAGLEFSWNPAVFDVENDGDQDIYLVGALSRGNDNFLGDWSGNPGRLLVNESKPGHFVFTDRTVEYRLLDITDMDYTSNPPRRPAPGTNWHKSDEIYLTDTDAFAGSGLEASNSSIRDIFRMHESASNVQEADLNGDGFVDLIVPHMGGYNSNSPSAKNLRVEFAGRLLALPAPNKVINPPTTFEEGRTSLYVNGGPARGTSQNWVKIRLIDRTGFNRDGVGSRVIVNGKLARSYSIGGSFGSVSTPLHIGMGSQKLSRLAVLWPSGDGGEQRLVLKQPAANTLVCVDRQNGAVACP